MEWVVTDDIYRETWRRVLEFANVELTVDYITRRNGVPDKASRANYKKQAKQVRVCVLQAKEYFDAARASSVFTRPNHAYYGAVSLASMMMMLLGDGTQSLDYLRRDSQNKHHGLHFSTGCNAQSAAVGLDLIEQSFVEVLSHGHFANWYACLPRQGIVNAVVSRQDQAGNALVVLEPVGSSSTSQLQIGVKHSLRNLIKYFPDLSRDLNRYSITVVRSRTTHTVVYEPNKMVRHKWQIHGVRSPSELEALLAKFEVPLNFIDCITEQRSDTGTSALVTIAWNTQTGSPSFKFPSSRDTLNCDTFSYADELDTHEIVDLYLVAYQLSMLSRYFPDLWISCVESQCKAAKIVERSIDIFIQKFSILALSMLSPNGLTISTHRAPWHD